MFVYKITNLLDGKAYIGITRYAVELRFRRHLERAKAKDGCKYLCAAINKYGKESFRVETLATAATWEELVVLERALIASHGTHWTTGKGYNLTIGGEGTLGRTVIPEALVKLVRCEFPKKAAHELVDIAREKLGVIVHYRTLQSLRKGMTGKYWNEQYPPVLLGQGTVSTPRKQAAVYANLVLKGAATRFQPGKIN